jgi:low molecular weight protein-tyrosine phosphatase
VRALIPPPVVSVLRDALWLARGLDIRNPPLPASVQSMLFVCKGNICRSPFAALIARRLAGETGLERCRFESAGITPSRDDRCPDEAIETAMTFEVALSSHRPLKLDTHLGQEFDLIVVMDTEQLDLLRARWPFWRHKIVLLALFDPLKTPPFLRYNIVDPYGRSREHFDRCYDRIERSVRNLLLTLASIGSRAASIGPPSVPPRDRRR